MSRERPTRRAVLRALLAAPLLGGCRRATTPAREVVVFTALDRMLSEPILDRFTAATGIAVRAVYDGESSKTTGLVNRIIARRDDPECDVHWNNEPLQTAHLARLGLLRPFEGEGTERFDARWRHPRGLWTGFAARARVIVSHAASKAAAPTGLADFADPARRGRGAMAQPFFGTTFTHVGMLVQAHGAEATRDRLAALRANGTRIAPGNGPVRDLVAAGVVDFGLTDTDDAFGGLLDGKPLDIHLPDPDEGVALIPNTVALVAGGPNPSEAEALASWLLSARTERALAEARGAQIPLGSGVDPLSSPFGAWRLAPLLPFDPDAADRPALVALLRAAGFTG